MTHVRTTAATVAIAVALLMVPQIIKAVAASALPPNAVAQASVEPLSPLGSVHESDVVDVIDGVRIVSDTSEHTELVVKAVEKFAQAGWDLTNTEVRFDAAACDRAVGFHTEERGHHSVVMCTDAEWTLLHELGHVWSDLYLDEGQRNEWIALQGLASWSEGDWEERGTEHAADIIAFGLHDTMHVPTGIGVTDYRSLVESFEWLLGTAPLHRQHGDHATSGRTTSQRIQVVAPRRVAPSDAPALAEPTSQASPASEFTFPMACGYPRWNSLHGGFGYVDPRDWTHNGVDLYAFEGTPVVSPVHGTVVEAGWGDVTGWKVVVADRFGYRHVLEHLSQSPIVGIGTIVTAGRDVGAVGRTGNAAGGGPHLHYEIRLDGEPVDPMPWLRATGGSHVEAAPASLYATTAPVWSACAAKA